MGVSAGLNVQVFLGARELLWARSCCTEDGDRERAGEGRGRPQHRAAFPQRPGASQPDLAAGRRLDSEEKNVRDGTTYRPVRMRRSAGRFAVWLMWWNNFLSHVVSATYNVATLQGGCSLLRRGRNARFRCFVVVVLRSGSFVWGKV